MTQRFPPASLILLTAMLVAVAAPAATKNGFDLSGSLVPAHEIRGGGPVRDGIPSIDAPKFVPAHDADFLDAEDRVLGLIRNGQARAYPIRIMNWHEIVNDRLGGTPIAVTYCPLCGTGVAFRAQAGSQELGFGVSGLLYNSDMLLYDRDTESLWSQIKKQAITGPMKGRRLEMLPLTHTNWRAWLREHPGTEVLSTDTGYRRDYTRYPYGGYETERGLYFPVSAKSRRFHPKERVLGIEVNGVHKAYPFAELSKTGGEIRDLVGDKEILIRFDWANDSARALDTAGNQLPAMTAFWFAWFAFHPDTQVFEAKRG
ncbi:MAG: hypothetical protein N838_26240 [Thiohalocapsa sp. PB-PSB1]|jgi:hypothetical protein|nr:MAG: hypothetical protein N838_26240 [Thiohalocapsa sp. PB-PSB1]